MEVFSYFHPPVKGSLLRRDRGRIVLVKLVKAKSVYTELHDPDFCCFTVLRDVNDSNIIVYYGSWHKNGQSLTIAPAKNLNLTVSCKP